MQRHEPLLTPQLKRINVQIHISSFNDSLSDFGVISKQVCCRATNGSWNVVHIYTLEKVSGPVYCPGVHLNRLVVRVKWLH